MKLEGIPADLADANLEEGSVHVVLDEGVYPLDAVYGAAYVFIDRCWVWIGRPAQGRLRVVLTPKKGAFEAASLRELAGELANELLSNAWRHQITRENRTTIEAVTMQAIAGAMGPPSLDDLEDFDFSEEPFEDPLGIAQSWEEKYAAKKGGDAAASPAGEATAAEAEGAAPGAPSQAETEEAP